MEVVINIIKERLKKHKIYLKANQDRLKKNSFDTTASKTYLEAIIWNEVRISECEGILEQLKNIK